MSTSISKYRLDRRAGQQGSRPSVRGQAEVEKSVTGHHYSEVTGWSIHKRYRTQNTKIHHNICIGSINTTTMKDPIKRAQCISQCKFLEQNITFFQETHIIGHNTILFNDSELNGWTFINSGLKCKASAGVGIALSPDVKLIDIENILEGRILLARVVLHGIKISAFCAYAPTEQYADSTKEIFFSTLQKAIQKVKKEHPCFKILIGADMNATIGCNSFGSWSYLGPNNDNLKTNENGTRLLSLSEECRLFIMNSFYHSKKIHRHTWYSPTGFTKRVDYILAEWHLKKLSSNCRVYRKATVPFETNHRLLAMTCSFPSKRNRKAFFSKASKPSKPYKDISSLRNDPVICNKFSEKMDEIFVDEPSVNDINIFENFFTESIIQASESEIPKILKSSHKCPWTSDEFLSLLEKRKSCNDPSIRRELGISIKKLRTTLRNDYFSKLANNINTSGEARKIEEEFRLCKTYTMTKHSNINLIPSEKLTEFFIDHLKAKINLSKYNLK